MKAIVSTRYGPPEVLKVKENAQTGSESRRGLYQNQSTGVTSGDIRVRSFDVLITVSDP